MKRIILILSGAVALSACDKANYSVEQGKLTLSNTSNNKYSVYDGDTTLLLIQKGHTDTTLMLPVGKHELKAVQYNGYIFNQTKLYTTVHINPTSDSYFVFPL